MRIPGVCLSSVRLIYKYPLSTSSTSYIFQRRILYIPYLKNRIRLYRISMNFYYDIYTETVLFNIQELIQVK